MDLDYYITTPDPTSGTSIYNTRYNPRLHIDILRATIPAYPGYRTLLSSESQNAIWVYLEDLSVHPPGTPYSQIPLRIGNVKVTRRWGWSFLYPKGNRGGYEPPENLKTCHIWSWLCADRREYPYYEYIYQDNFDQYGKKGSMRHFVTSCWGQAVGMLGVRQANALLTGCVSLVLGQLIYTMFQGLMNVVEVHRKRIQEVDEWLADEEVEGSLNIDRYVEGTGKLEKELGWDQNPLSPSPLLDIPKKSGKSSIS
jgi:hypothetical protein